MSKSKVSSQKISAEGRTIAEAQSEAIAPDSPTCVVHQTVTIHVSVDRGSSSSSSTVSIHAT